MPVADHPEDNPSGDEEAKSELQDDQVEHDDDDAEVEDEVDEDEAEYEDYYSPPGLGQPLRRRSPKPGPAAVAATLIAGVVIAAGTFAIVGATMDTKAIQGPPAAQADFDVGVAETRARSIARDRTPLLFQDPLGDGRNIYLQFLNGRWLAFEARRPGAARGCILVWRRPAQHFEDSCTAEVVPADGSGLVSYPTRLDDSKHLLVNLRSPIGPTP